MVKSHGGSRTHCGRRQQEKDFNAQFPALDSKANRQLRLLWIACGTDAPHYDIETPGGYTWMVLAAQPGGLRGIALPVNSKGLAISPAVQDT